MSFDFELAHTHIHTQIKQAKLNWHGGINNPSTCEVKLRGGSACVISMTGPNSKVQKAKKKRVM